MSAGAGRAPIALPAALRRLVPDRVRDDVRLRAVAVGAGLIPPRTMHSAEDAAVLRAVAEGCRTVVELGVYEGSSAVVLCEVLEPRADLHLVDPFGRHPSALPAGWGATERATRRVVARAARRHQGPAVHWHVQLSAAVAQHWSGGAVDLVFVDADHAQAAVEEDWRLWSPHVAAGGVVLFHDARLSQPGGRGLPGPTAVVDRLFRGADALDGWRIVREADRSVAVARQSP